MVWVQYNLFGGFKVFEHTEDPQPEPTVEVDISAEYPGQLVLL